jgi:hypothetical protein
MLKGDPAYIRYFPIPETDSVYFDHGESRGVGVWLNSMNKLLIYTYVEEEGEEGSEVEYLQYLLTESNPNLFEKEINRHGIIRVRGAEPQLHKSPLLKPSCVHHTRVISLEPVCVGQICQQGQTYFE